MVLAARPTLAEVPLADLSFGDQIGDACEGCSGAGAARGERLPLAVEAHEATAAAFGHNVEPPVESVSG